MQVIRDAEGNIIRRSKNLAGIRRFMRDNVAKTIAIDKLANSEGKLCILFVDGCSFETNFASFTVLKQFVKNWLSAYGSQLIVNGEQAGTLVGSNPHLK